MKVLETEEDIDLSNNNHLLLIQSLLDSIPQTQAFKGKWSLIAGKVSDLKIQLANFSDLPTSTDWSNSLSLEVLHYLSSTLSDALSLSKTCHSPTLTAGKLRTQNDIDSISAKLTRHVTDIDILIKSGVLQEAGASATSKRESVRVSCRTY